MKKCPCNGTRKTLNAKMPDGKSYNYSKCSHCGEKTLDLNQLHTLAEQYRAQKTKRKTIPESAATMLTSEHVLKKDWDNKSDE